MLTENSRIKEVYNHPIGKDIIQKILMQLGYDDKFILNPVINNLKLKSLPQISKKIIDEDFLKTLLELLNSESSIPLNDACEATRTWWKEAVFYQIYPRSFKDSNGDGIGDICGIIEKLDYLKELGIDAIWLSPIYDSPNDDNGYDIRDYHKIMNEFGTMEDFDQLLQEIHSRKMKLIMDLVVNHTSDEHEWFVKAVNEPQSKYGDYYFFSDTPNNWSSFFSGSAWKYINERNQYALHLFSKKQMDLNWDNPNVRNEIHDMVRYWLIKGVDGFRLDVINYISKRNGLPNGNEVIGKLMGYYGIEHYFYGPHLHDYLHELNEKVFSPFNAFSVGETPGIGMQMSKLLTADYRKELDMVFSFDHLENPGHTRFDDYQYNLNFYKKLMIDWMENYGNHCQASLFYDNHDNPRMISKINSNPLYRNILAKLLAVIQFTLRGTPFIYQGQELGMINKKFSNINELRDVESLNLYSELCSQMSPKDAFEKVLNGTRDHARTPMQWTNDKYAGFSEVKPWIESDDDYEVCNAKNQISSVDSVFTFYKSLIKLKKECISLTYGDIKIINKKVNNLFTFYRAYKNELLYIECNLSEQEIQRKGNIVNGVRLISNYNKEPIKKLRPYEATVWRLK